MDKYSKETRSKVMRAVKSKDTKIEVKLRKALWRRGVRYRKNYKACGCRIDIAITKWKLAVFCDGEFWHGKNFRPGKVATNEEYWNQKILRNMERDFENLLQLRDEGWTVLRFWEKSIEKELEACVQEVMERLQMLKSVRFRREKNNC